MTQPSSGLQGESGPRLSILCSLQIGDEDRGYQIELLLTKLRFATDAAASQLSPNQGLQIVGMSATMPNGAQLATWLKAEFLQTDFRPVPLTQHILVRHLRNFPIQPTGLS